MATRSREETLRLGREVFDEDLLNCLSKQMSELSQQYAKAHNCPEEAITESQAKRVLQCIVGGIVDEKAQEMIEIDIKKAFDHILE